MEDPSKVQLGRLEALPPEASTLDFSRVLVLERVLPAASILREMLKKRSVKQMGTISQERVLSVGMGLVRFTNGNSVYVTHSDLT